MVGYLVAAKVETKPNRATRKDNMADKNVQKERNSKRKTRNEAQPGCDNTEEKPQA